jgi:sialate O-acetylesterase
MYNSMILPYSEGPMSLSGFLWYQGEANTQNATSAEQYGCLLPELIKAWRDAFQSLELFFAFVQLSTWCALPPASLPQMRDAQMKAVSALKNVGYATNADHGDGCYIHPNEKQWVSERLANSALALVYKKPIQWKSPSYKMAQAVDVEVPGSHNAGAATAKLTVMFADLGQGGLETRYPSNLRGSYNSDMGPPGPSNPAAIVDCSGSFPINATANASMAFQCAWASLNVEGVGWLNASISLLGSPPSQLVLSAVVPNRNSGDGGTQQQVTASSYGWGPIPMMTLYDRTTGLPVLPWNRTVA